VPAELLVDRLLNDADPRVRSNTIEALEARAGRAVGAPFVQVLAQRARESESSRERANAVKALHTMRVAAATTQLLAMLRDDRPEHRVSALWALRQIGWWQLLNEVGRLAKEDANLRVRRYALGVLRGVAEMLQAQKRQGPEKLAG
jgi:HEAT repeat protein